MRIACIILFVLYSVKYYFTLKDHSEKAINKKAIELTKEINLLSLKIKDYETRIIQFRKDSCCEDSILQIKEKANKEFDIIEKKCNQLKEKL